MSNTVKLFTSVIEQYANQAGLQNSCPSFFCESQGKSFESRLSKSLTLMAPMAGVSDAPYRIMARLGGARLAYSEMVSVAGLHYKSDKTWDLLEPHPLEPEIAVQLFGSNPKQFKEAIVHIQNALGSRLALIDINMACPVAKVVKKGEGSALLSQRLLAKQIVQEAVSVSKVPVTVKIRKVPKALSYSTIDFAKDMQASGCRALALHGRYASQLYSGVSDDESIKELKSSLKIPLIASGDVKSAERVCELKQTTGVDAVFCARGTYGNPWIFSDAHTLHGVNSSTDHIFHTIEERIYAFILHVKLLELTHSHIAKARSLSGWYFKNLPHATDIRQKAVSLYTAQEFIDLAYEVLHFAQAQTGENIETIR